MQALGASHHGRHRLDRGAHNIIVRILFRETRPRGLAMCAQHERARVLWREMLFHQRGPQQPTGPHLGDFHVEVHTDAPEKREPSRESIDVEPLGHRRTHVIQSVGNRERQLEITRRSGFLHMVARNTDRIELRHLFRGVLDDIGNNPHRGSRRINIGIPNHELLEDIVLDRPGELVSGDALLLTRNYEAGKHRQDSTVHRHGYRHLVQRNLVEEHLHVFDGINGNASLAHITHHTRMIGIVTAMCREVESDRQAHLSCGQIGPVEVIGLLRRREACVLANRPGTLGVHRGSRATNEGKSTRNAVAEIQTGSVFLSVERFDVDAFRRLPDQIVRILALAFLGGELTPKFQIIVARVSHASMVAIRSPDRK